MNKRAQSAMARGTAVLIVLSVTGGCLLQDHPATGGRPEDHQQCVTPLKKIPLNVSLGGISTTGDGSLFGVAGVFGVICVFNNQGEVIWKKEGVAGRHNLFLDEGAVFLAGSYNKEEPWKSTIIKFDSEGNILWERQTGSIGLDGLAATPDGSFIAVGARDEQEKGHVKLFDQDGNELWDHQIDGRVETVAVSKSGYVVAGPRDRNIYVYDCHGDLGFKYFANSFLDCQDTAISPDESYFLFGSENEYLNCYTLQGSLLWQREVPSLCNIRISVDGEYIVVGTAESTLFLFDKNGTNLWSKKVTDAFFVNEVAISDHAEYIAVNVEVGSFIPRLYVAVYDRQGNFLWQYEGCQPFMAIAISGDGHYLAAGNSNFLVLFDNFQAIKEYESSECAKNKSHLRFFLAVFHAL